MEKRQLGNSTLQVTRMGLGLAALGRPGYINLGHAADLNHDYDMVAMETHAHEVLDAAWAAGIRYFDAARSYGRAEAFLASWLQKRQIAPSAVTIGSKWGYTYTADWQVTVPEGQQHEVKDLTLPVLQRQLRESRALLGEFLDMYQIHSATLDSGVLENRAVLAELARLRNDGLAIGLSVSGPAQAATIERALAVLFDGVLLFAAVQATWNLLEQSATAALQAAHEAGVGVIVKEALANGRLTERNPDPHFKARWAALPLATRQIPVDALALAAVSNQPFVDVVLSGAAQVDHLQSNLKALNVTWDSTLAEAVSDWGELPDVYWHKRTQLAWN
jgi:aryl-alcohol dehydrogenase-like predicted oxidoreductase